MYDRLRDLPLSVEGCEFEINQRDTSSDFTRVTTVVTLEGGGSRGRGEDVTYDEEAHRSLVDATFQVEGEYTLDEFSAGLDDLDLFPAGAPDQAAFRHDRRWAFESAALDLGLRQAGTNLGAALRRSDEPVRFVVNTRLGDPPRADRLRRLLDIGPDLAFKLDPIGLGFRGGERAGAE